MLCIVRVYAKVICFAERIDMRRKGIEYISNYIKTMICDENIIRIMKQNTEIEIANWDFAMLDLPDGMNGFFSEYSEFKMISAYEPFLNIIKEMVNRYDIDIDSILEQSEIYSLQKSVFKSYIQTGHVVREEKILLGEVKFEKEKFEKGISNLLLNIAEMYDIFILINDANLMCDSTLSVIECLNEYSSYKLKILLITNEMGKNKSYVAERYEKFLAGFDEKGLVLDWPFEDEEKVYEETDYNISNLEELLNIRDMFYTLAIEQAEYYINIIYQRVELEKINVSMSYRIEMLTLYIMISIFRQNHSYALVLCDKLNAVNAGKLSDKKDYEYYYYKSLANMYMGNVESAVKGAGKCIETAKKFDDEFMMFNALMIQNMSEFAGWRDIGVLNKYVVVPKELIDMCYKYNYMNHLAHIYVYCFDNELEKYKKVEGIEERIPTVSKGFEIAQNLGNDQFLIEAYRKSIMLASYNGYFNVESYFHAKSMEVAKRTKNRLEEANIYNGLGYNCCTADKYNEANRYYNKALGIFYEEKLSDYMIETLYNIGMNAILAGDYSHAFEYFKHINKILKILKKNSLRVCNISKIFGLTAVAAFKSGEYYGAQFYASKAENFLRNILDYKIEELTNYAWSDDVFLYYYVSALIAERMNKDKEALEYFNRASEHMLKSAGSMFFNYVHYAVDKSKLLKKVGRNKEAESILREAKDYYEKTGNYLRVRMFNELLNTGKWEISPMNMAITSVSMDTIMEYIKIESIKEEVESKRQQMRFFGTFQELVNQEYNSVENEIETVINNFRINFNLDNILFINCEDKEPKIKFNDLEYDISKEDIQKIVEYFKINTSGFVLSKYSNNYQEYDSILKIFEKSKIFSIIAAPIFKLEKLCSIFIIFVRISDSWASSIDREVLDEDDFEMYMIVFRMILDAIEKYRLNDQLKLRAVTDELTGLYNRNGYYEILDEKIEKTGDLKEGVNASMMYMDLDHFKYYNDTYGHQVGDELLKEFAGIIKKACKNYGNVIRFGGDEFVILLDTIDEKIIKNVSDDIYREIERCKGFKDVVKKFKNDVESIPMEYMLTCSIGIDVIENAKTIADFEILQKHADEALYYGKNHGKGRAMRYAGINRFFELK